MSSRVEILGRLIEKSYWNNILHENVMMRGVEEDVMNETLIKGDH